MTNEYEERKQARIARYRERAEKAEAEAAAKWNSQANKTLTAMNGEPVKIGHHSEGRHRALIAQADRDCRKASAAMDKADYYRCKAEAAEHNKAISADDPEAEEKLQHRLATLKKNHARLKRDNAILRQLKLSADDQEAEEKLTTAGVSPQGIVELLQLISIAPYQLRPYVKHPGYELANNNAKIKATEKRLGKLQRQADAPVAAPIVGDGFRISEDVEWGRILIKFPSKPPLVVCKWLKSHGWHWAKSRMAWVRYLNENGKVHARFAAEELLKLS